MGKKTINDIIVIKEPDIMRELTREKKASKLKVAFVPTMGFLHKGHLALVKKAKKEADFVIVSIFVNPIQFGEKEDLDSYPTDIQRDLKLLSKEGTDAVFIPSTHSIYPENFQTFVDVKQITKGLCGSSRPGHFKGVTTVVLKLFNMVEPDIALFGLKDYQQYVAIKTMIKDLDLKIEIIGVDTVREKDGLALSSRNSRLSEDHKNQAIYINKGLKSALKAHKNGTTKTYELIDIAKNSIISQPELEIVYLEIRDAETLDLVSNTENPCVMAAAVKVGNTMLIDNIILS